ncbi:MAG: DMT family transporter [Acidimicrobiia bacterium]|nr:DMT family transporter [Acidimicrobiia bacterium]
MSTASSQPAAPRADEQHAGSSMLGVSAVVGATLAWTLGTLLVKSMDASGLWITFWRFVLVIPLALAFLLSRGWKQARRTFRATWPGGVLFGIHVLVYFSALRTTSVAVVTFVAALQPVLVMLVAGRWLGERITPVIVAWSLVSIAGVGLVVVGSAAGGETTPLGNVLAVVTLFLWTAYFLVSKWLRRPADGTDWDPPSGIDAVPYQGTVLLVSCAVVTPLVLVFGGGTGQVRGGDWLVMIPVMLVPSIGHLMVNWAHRYVAASVSSLVVLAVPVLAGVGAAVFLGEPFGPLQIGGGALVLASTGVVVHHSTRAASEIPPEDA